MTATEEPLDSAYDWVAEHTRRYVETGGEEGHDWNGVPTLVLTTRGARSGHLRRNALIYGVRDHDHIVVASKGGDARHPLWYRNLVAEPRASIQVGSETVDVTAATAGPGEQAMLWPMMGAIWPEYETYQARTTRDIPVIVLSAR